MAWHRIGDKPLSEAMLVCFTDAFMRQSASMSYNATPPCHVCDIEFV